MKRPNPKLNVACNVLFSQEGSCYGFENLLGLVSLLFNALSSITAKSLFYFGSFKP